MSRTSFVVLILLALVWLAGGTVRRALPPAVVVIQAGPLGGSYDEHARRYARHLQAAGLATEVQNIADSVQIVEAVNRDTPRVDIGFTAQAVDPATHPNVVSAGVIELQPLFLFHRSSLGEPASLAELQGKSLVMPAQGSATSRAARDVLAQYGVTPENTRFTYLPIAEATRALQRGEHDAGFFMLAPSNAMIARLAGDENLRLFSFIESVGISRQLDYLKPAVLARGAFDLRRLRPHRDVGLVGATVNVVVRHDIHPAVLYALLNVMREAHQGQSLVTDHGTYPSLVGTALPAHPLAAAWAQTGTPWLFKHFSPGVAGVVDAYWGPALFLVALVSAFGTLRSINELIQEAALKAALLYLSRLQKRVDAGRRLGGLSRVLFRLVEPVVLQQDSAALARDQLERLRPHLHPS